MNTPRQRFLVLPRWLLLLLIGAIVATSLFLILFGVRFSQAIADAPRRNQATRTVPLMPAIIGDLSDLEAATIPTAEPLPLPALSINNRLTVLVMGVDSRPGEQFASRTDSMLVLSINPEADSASILSIPRDLYVTMQNGQRNRINTALAYGAYGGDIHDGGKYVIEVIQNNVGVPIDHYLILDFQTVVEVIDQVGGVTVDVPYAIDDPTYPDMNYGYDPLYIEAGTQELDGQTALKYMRTRHVDNDFGRSQRQQQVILAFRDALLADGVTSLSKHVYAIQNQFREGVITDMGVTDMLGLANAGSNIAGDNIQSAVLDANYVYDYTTESGAYVLIPYSDRIATLAEHFLSF